MRLPRPKLKRIPIPAFIRGIRLPDEVQKNLDKRFLRPLRQIWKEPKYKFPLIFASIWGLLGFLILQVEVTGKGRLFHNAVDTIYYTITTVTGTGYGDITPKTTLGRFIAVCLMFVGVVSVSTITANIASYLVEQTVREAKGLISYKMKDHYIICGYKPEMASILEDILLVNPTLLPEQIILIHNADPTVMDNIRANPKLKGVSFVHGECNDEQVLARASTSTAKTALVFSDMTNPGATLQEIDSRTLTTVLSLRNMSRELYVCAELLDEKLEKHLRLSGADEIIMSRAYSRTLLANASAATGVSQVIRDLIDVNEVNLQVIPFPAVFVGKTFKQLVDWYYEEHGHLLIGILENVGNVHHRKSEALRDAQKEPDISKLVKNLQWVKKMIPNSPVLNPGLDYILPSHSHAVVVVRKPNHPKTVEPNA